MARAAKIREVDAWEGFGMLVGGPRPYMTYDFSNNRSEVEKECTEPYQRVVEAVIIPKSRYQELRRAERELGKITADDS